MSDPSARVPERQHTAPDGRGTSSRLAVLAVFGFGLGAAAALSSASPDAYAFLLGPLDFFLLTATVATLGAVALWLLGRYGWFRATARARDVLVALAAGCCLTVPVVVVDVLGGFPAQLNVRFPESLLFYPSVALVAESLFHLVPLALLASIWKVTRFELDAARRVAIGLVALVEPMLQVAFFSGQASWATNVFLGLYVLAFNLVSLEIFRRSGFVALYALRLGYYLIWHIAWGHLRLSLLFGGSL